MSLWPSTRAPPHQPAVPRSPDAWCHRSPVRDSMPPSSTRSKWNTDELHADISPYDEALSFINMLKEVAPRSASPAALKTVFDTLLNLAGLPDTTLDMRATPLGHRGELDSLNMLASISRQMRLRGVGRQQIEQELTRNGIDWRAQDQRRTQACRTFRPGSGGVRFEEMLLGIGIGDAFGAGIEFQDGRWVNPVRVRFFRTLPQYHIHDSCCFTIAHASFGTDA